MRRGTTRLAVIIRYRKPLHQAFFEKGERLAERFEADARRTCATGVALDFLRDVRCCDAVTAKARASCFLVVFPKRYCFPAPLLPSFIFPVEGRSGKGKSSCCDTTGMGAGASPVTRSL